MDGQEILGMSDEDFMANMSTLQQTATDADAISQQHAQEQSTDTGGEQTAEAEHSTDEAGVEAGEQQPANGQDPHADNQGTERTTEQSANSHPGSEVAAPAADAETKPAEAEKPVTPSADTDYKAFHDRVMAPFVANGKTIQLQNVDEAVQLMQMGANYTRKMQAIAPHRKVLMMLENNGLLDESKLSRLIDLEKKNPDAIRALVKEAGIDPLDIDVQGESTYTPGNHTVPDEAVAFQTTLDEVSSTPDGQETVRQITASWDAESKAELWKDPSILGTIHQQRISGVYDRVVAEIERQRTIGAIPANVSLLNAYRVIGERMTQAGAFQDLVAAQRAAQQPAVQHPVATRVASAAKPAVANSGKVNAAAPTRTAAPRRAEAFINPLAMPDDEFMKQFANRV